MDGKNNDRKIIPQEFLEFLDTANPINTRKSQEITTEELLQLLDSVDPNEVKGLDLNRLKKELKKEVQEK